MAFDYTNYYELNYIESTGTQYINTGTPIGANYKVDGVFSLPAIQSDKYFFGVRGRSADMAYTFAVVQYSATSVWASYDNNHDSDWIQKTFNWVANTDYHIVLDMKSGSQLFSINDNVLSTGSLSFSSNSERPLYIFAFNNNGTAGNLSSQKCKSLKIYYNDELIRDFVPAMRKSDYVVGLYDSVNNQFYTNVGSGTIQYGGIVADKSEFDGLDYIQSSGTQGIITDVQTTSELKVDIVYSNISVSSTQYVFGGGDGWENNMLAITQYPLFGFANTSTIRNIPNELNKKYNAIVNKNAIEFFYDGTRIYSNSYAYSSFSSKYSLALFGTNFANTLNQFASIKLYSCKIYSNDTLVRNFIPAKHKTYSNLIGLYDTVNGVFYTNKGTGTFTYGSVLSEYTLSLSTNPVDIGALTGAGTYYEGEEVTATWQGDPTINYTFNRWTSGGTNVSISPTYTFIINSNTSLVAQLDKFGRCILL